MDSVIGNFHGRGRRGTSHVHLCLRYPYLIEKRLKVSGAGWPYTSPH